jgi:hypothetical protein
MMAGCFGGGGGDSSVPDDPNKGIMSKETADQIYQVELVDGGYEITGFKSARHLASWLLKTDDSTITRAVFTVTIPDTFTIPTINNMPVVSIADRAFKTDEPGGNTDISSIVNDVVLPPTIKSLGVDLFEGVKETIALSVPPEVKAAVGEDKVIAAAGDKAIPVDTASGTTIAPEAPPDEFTRPGTAAQYILASYEADTGKVNQKDSSGSIKWYTVNDGNLKALFNAIYEPNKTGSTDTAEKTTITFSTAISVSSLDLFKITVGASAAGDKVELTGTHLPSATNASNKNIIVVDIGIPGADNNALPTFYIPKEKANTLGDANVQGDYSHIRLRVNKGANLVILADNSNFTGAGNPCPEGNFKGGCVEVMAGGKLRDGAYEGFPLGTGAVILNRAGSWLAVGPEDELGKPELSTSWQGWLLGPVGTEPRILWDAGNTADAYLEVRSKQIATNAKLKQQKGLGLIYSIWFVGPNAKLTIDVSEDKKSTYGFRGLHGNESAGGEDYNFYSTQATADLITITAGSVLDKRFLIKGALDLNQSSHLITGSNSITIPGKATGEGVEYGSGTGIYGYLVTNN